MKVGQLFYWLIVCCREICRNFYTPDISLPDYICSQSDIVLRLFPPVPINFRVSATDTSLPVGGGPDGKSPIYIKKGTAVTYIVYAMHRRKDIWGPDADSFRPERWEENAKRGWEYLPFNGGPRICLGRTFPLFLYPLFPEARSPWFIEQITNLPSEQYALTEASFTIVKLMQHFDTVENADPGLQKPVLLSNLTMSHDKGVWIKFYNSEKGL